MARSRRLSSDSHHAGIGELVDGRYRIRGTLGRGAWSVVYDAIHEATGQPVALKMLLRNLPGGDEAAEARFFREAHAMASLTHPNTLRVFDVGRTAGGALYLASQRLHGPTLEAVLSEREERGEVTSPAELAPILEAVLSSLAEAHDRGLVHRDIKPGNIMLHQVGDEQFVKVLDFGIAMWVADAAAERWAGIGTPDAMSPEQCAGQELDARSDLYAVAALAFRALAGRSLFLGYEVDDVLRQHREVPAPDVRTVAQQPVPPALAGWVATGLAKHPKDRWPNARAARQALREAMAGWQQHAPDASALHVSRQASSSAIPAVPQVASFRHTGTWRVGLPELVGSPTEVFVLDSAPRQTARYAMVQQQDLDDHRARAPSLEEVPAAAEAPAATSTWQRVVAWWRGGRRG